MSQVREMSSIPHTYTYTSVSASASASTSTSSFPSTGSNAATPTSAPSTSLRDQTIAASPSTTTTTTTSTNSNNTTVGYSNGRLLSIQSSVVYGYVGNKASNFPLQLLGFDVDPIHSCQFSNHTGHPTFSGYKTTGQDARQITKGLKDNQFIQQYSLLLTGYMSSVEFLEESVHLIQDMKKLRPDLVYACDPVLGDNGQLYVPPEFVSIYRDSILPLADIVTPNQTEAETLSGIEIRDESSAYANLHWFHSRGIRTVVITSMTFPSHDDRNGMDRIEVIGSTLTDLSNPYPDQYVHMSFPKVPTYFSGTGDLTTALLLGWLVKEKSFESSPSPHSNIYDFSTLVRSVELTMSTLQSVIHRTAEAKSSEILLIQSKRDIESPPNNHRATIIDARILAKQLRNQQ